MLPGVGGAPRGIGVETLHTIKKAAGLLAEVGEFETFL
jgi:hypothetical protein